MWKTRQLANLAVQILNENYGELVATIGESLLKRGSLTLRQLAYTTNVNLAKTKKALLALIQHGMVDFKQNNRNMIEYTIHADMVIYHIYADREVNCAGILYGEAAKMIVEELLQEGCLPLPALVDTVTDRLNEAIKDQGADIKEVQPSYIQDKFERMVTTHFIRRCSAPVKDNKGKTVALEPLLPIKMFEVPPKSAAGNAVKVKQEPTGESQVTNPRMSQQAGSDDAAPVYWEVNHKRFLQHFRDQTLAAAVGNQLDNEKAAEVMRIMLRICEKSTDPDAETTMPLSFNEIYSQMPKTTSRNCVERLLKLMTHTMPMFITRVGDSAGGMYIIKTFEALKFLCMALFKSVVEERFGSKSKRIFEVIVEKKHLEEDTIAKLSLVSPKQTRTLLFTMFQENFIHKLDQSKFPDYPAAQTINLFRVEDLRLARILLQNSYKARPYFSLKNIKRGRQHLLSDTKRLLEKQERLEAILLSLGLPPFLALGDEADRQGLDIDDEKKEQLDAIMETLTPADSQQLKKVKALTQHYELAEQEVVNNSIFILESYLSLTYKPPAPKRVRNLLA
ncbi:hypothetical protein ACOMHN_017581 [Nucella lapillus]